MQLAARDTLVANAFIQSGKRERFVQVASCRQLTRDGRVTQGSRKQAAKYRLMLAGLEHWLDPNRRRLSLGTGSRHDTARDAFGEDATVYVLSESAQIDGQVLELAEVFSHLTTNKVYGSLLVNPHCSLAYYESCELAEMTQLLSTSKTGSSRSL